MNRLAAGDPAPPFCLPGTDGGQYCLSQFHGRWLVVYFYPRDHTSGCTRQACMFRDRFQELRRTGAALLGISLDSPQRHRQFADRQGLPFPLLSDADGSVSQAFGVLFRLGPLRFARRVTFVIDLGRAGAPRHSAPRRRTTRRPSAEMSTFRYRLVQPAYQVVKPQAF